MTQLSALMRSRPFRRLYGTRLVSQTADGVFQVALAGYVFFAPDQQTEPGKAAAAFAVLLLPYSLVGPFAGVFIDRWSRRQILLYAPLVRALLTAVVALLLFGGADGAPFYLVSLLVLGVNRFFLSALSAALPHVVADEELVLANTVSTTSGTVVAFVGAGGGYLLRLGFGGGSAGTGTILLCCSVAYVLAAAVARLLGRGQLGPDLDESPPRTREALASVARGLADGARHIARCRPAAWALGAISLHRFLYGIVLLVAGLLYSNTFASSADAGLGGYAIFLSVDGAGFLVGALITPWVVHRIGKARWIRVQLLAAAVAVPLLGLSFARLPLIALGFVLGVVSQGIKLSVDTTLQETIEDAYRGRVFAVYDMLFNTTLVAAAAAAALVLPESGRAAAVLVAIAALYALASIAYRRPAPARIAAHADGLIRPEPPTTSL